MCDACDACDRSTLGSPLKKDRRRGATERSGWPKMRGAVAAENLDLGCLARDAAPVRDFWVVSRLTFGRAEAVPLDDRLILVDQQERAMHDVGIEAVAEDQSVPIEHDLVLLGEAMELAPIDISRTTRERVAFRPIWAVVLDQWPNRHACGRRAGHAAASSPRAGLRRLHRGRAVRRPRCASRRASPRRGCWPAGPMLA